MQRNGFLTICLLEGKDRLPISMWAGGLFQNEERARDNSGGRSFSRFAEGPANGVGFYPREGKVFSASDGIDCREKGFWDRLCGEKIKKSEKFFGGTTMGQQKPYDGSRKSWEE